MIRKDFKYRVIDNFLDNDSFAAIQRAFLNSDFPWIFGDSKSGYDSSTMIYNFQFVHMFYRDYAPQSKYFDLLKPLVAKLEPASIIRIKANLTTPTPEILQFAYHRDIDYISCKTGVLYVTTNNGYTVFQNGEKVQSVENRLVFFDSDIYHAGSTCTDEKRRIVLNLNWIPIKKSSLND